MPLKTNDEFISQYPSEVQTILHKIRAAIQKSAPGVGKCCRAGVKQESFDAHQD